MQKPAVGPRPELALYFVLLASVAAGNGLSEAVFSNYFKEVYSVDAVMRGFIEFPREMPGLLCAAVIALLAPLGDLRGACIAQFFSLAGLIAMALITPPFGLMLVFLFVNSMGLHLFMPLQDAIGMSMAEPGQVGKRMGQFFSVRSAFGFLAGIVVFVGFRSGWLNFQSPIKTVFVYGSICFALAFAVSILLARRVRPARIEKKKIKLILRKEYGNFYALAILYGIQKQVSNVYGIWVIVDILGKKADTTSLLLMIGSFLCVFFHRYLGRWVDRFGIKRMVLVDALSFICIYTVFGLVIMGFTRGTLSPGMSALLIYPLFVLDRLSMQFGMVKSVYLRSIAHSPDEVTASLSMGTSLDHVVSIAGAMAAGFVWSQWGSQWVFFLGAIFSLGNLYIAIRIPRETRVTSLAAD